VTRTSHTGSLDGLVGQRLKNAIDERRGRRAMFREMMGYGSDQCHVSPGGLTPGAERGKRTRKRNRKRKRKRKNKRKWPSTLFRQTSLPPDFSTLQTSLPSRLLYPPEHRRKPNGGSNQVVAAEYGGASVTIGPSCTIYAHPSGIPSASPLIRTFAGRRLLVAGR